MSKIKKETLIKRHLDLDWNAPLRSIAKAVGVSHETVRAVKKTMKPPQSCQIDTGHKTAIRIYDRYYIENKDKLSKLNLRSIKLMIRDDVWDMMKEKKSLSPIYCARLLNKEKKNSRRAIPNGSKTKVIIKCLDLTKGLDFIKDSEIDLILMDPMYDRKSVETTYKQISEICGRVLKEGASALIMVGQAHLPIALSNLLTDKRLRYHWCLSVVLPRSAPSLQFLNVSPHHKIVLHLVKGNAYEGELYSDLIIAKNPPNKDKSYEYQQDQWVFDELARRFIQHSNCTLLDMTCGSGTSLIAGLRTGLCTRIIGVDKSENACKLARKSIKEELEVLKADNEPNP
jgi:hypothetical protein